MPALASGVHAPDIHLSFVDGKKFSLHEALKHGPVVAAFFKVSCPVCQFAFPYLERLFRSYGQGGKASFVGISQDSARDTQDFNSQFGITFPTLLDEKGKYPASNAYRLTNVPSIFLISREGEIEASIEASIVGWSKKDMEQLGTKLAELSETPANPIFSPAEKVPEYKPG
ncbi:MAG TPA: TlpA disulfide reductase family protein [Candidatus Angelobacter sp.]|nr:TlpA disulfide reductase family protein [Candidatus Angelobacter sp.]